MFEILQQGTCGSNAQLRLFFSQTLSICCKKTWISNWHWLDAKPLTLYSLVRVCVPMVLFFFFFRVLL